MLAFSFTTNAQISLTATAGTTSGSYTTLKGAFDAINAGTHTGTISISVTGSTTETAQAVLNSSGTVSASYTSVLIKPSSGTTATISGSISTSIIKLNGADNVTIDGSNATGGTSKDLTIKNNFVGTTAVTGGTTLFEATSGVIWIGSVSSTDAATGNTIKNCIVRGSTRKNTYACIWSANASTTGSTATNPYPGTPGAANNNTITNNTVGYAQHGIRNSVVSFLESNWVVTNNIIDSVFTNGIFISNATGVNISGNTINSASTTQDASSGTIHGIQTGGSLSGCTIANNKIVKVRGNSTNSVTAAYSARGITLTSSTSNANNLVYNNQVCDVSAIGIGTTNLIVHGIIATIGSTSAASTTNPIWRIYNNSVNLTTPNTSPNNGSSAFSVSLAGAANAGCMDVKNNIFANNISASSGNANYYAFFNFTATTANAFWGLDNNAYYTSNTNLGSNNPSPIANFAALQTSTSRETNGVFAQPTFTSATDLHLSLVSGNASFNNSGTPLTAYVTTDIDGASRSKVFPDMGADEIIYTPKVGAITPTSACAGSAFKISGADLTSPTAVSLAGVAAASYSNINSDTVSAVVASGYTSPVVGTVTVSTSYGSSTSTQTVTRNAPGSVTSQTLTVGSEGDQVRFTGTNLAGITSVTFNSTAATVVSSLATELVVTVPAGGSTGNLIITDGCGNAINRGTFTITAASDCATPSNQPSGFTATYNTSTLNGTFSVAASNPSGYLVVLSTTTLSSGPADGTAYTVGSSLGGGTVKQVSGSLNLSLTGLTGNTAYIVTIYAYNGGGCTSGPKYNTTNPLVYNFTTCSNIPNSVVATPNATNGNNIVFTWAIPTEGGANARAYNIDVATDAAFTSIVSSPSGISALTATVSGLNFATTYYYRIRTNNGCYSSYVTGSTTTLCGSSSALPYSQKFDNFTAQDLPAPGAANAVGCWTQENVNADAAVWKIGAAQGGSATTKSSPYCLRYDAAATYSGTGTTTRAANDIAYSPGFNLTVGTQYTISFWQSNYTNGENLALKVYSGSALSTSYLSDLWVGTGLRNTTPQYVYATFTAPTSGTYYFGFHITSTAYGGNPSAISQFVDNFKLETTPSAPTAPSGLVFSNIASSSFTVSWTDNSNNEDFFDVYTSEDGVTYSLNQTVDANSTSASVTNQNSSTLIYVQVKARNSGGTSSAANGSTTTLSCGGVFTTNTFTGSLFAGTTVNWNLAGNWSLGHTPISCENVVINANNIVPSSTTINYLYLNADATMHDLTIIGSNNPLNAGGTTGQRQALFIFTNGYRMNITGDLTISNDSTGGEASINDNLLLTSGPGNGPTATGPITVYGTTTIGNTGNRIASLGGGSTSGAGSITLKGDVVLGPQAYLNYGSLISYYFEKGGNQNLTVTSIQSGDATYGLGNMSIGSSTPTNLTIAGTGTSAGSSVVGDLTIGANSSLTLPSGQILNRTAAGGTLTMGVNSLLNVGGTTGGATGSNFPANFSLYSLANTSSVVYNGTASQSVNAAPIYTNLSINNSTGVGLNGNATVSNVLTLANGVISTGTNTLTMGLGATISGASSTRYINGTLAKTKAADVSGLLNFEIGDATQYAPVSVGFNGTTNSGGTLSANTTAGTPAALGYTRSGISTTDYVSRKYTLNNTGITGHTSIYPTFSYASADMMSAGTPSNSNYYIADSIFNGGWSIRTATNNGDPSSAATVSLVSGQSADYLIGSVDPPPAPTVNNLNPSTVCEGTSYVVSGTGFYAVTDVKIGSSSVSFTVNSPTQITIIVPVGLGNGAVTVTNVTNSATTSNSLTTLDQPQTTVTPSSQTICSGSALTTIVAGNSNNVPSTSYTWTRAGNNISGGTNTASGSGNIDGTLVSSSTTSETVTYTVNSSANGCTGTTVNATVTLKASPGVVNVNPTAAAICQTSVQQLDANYTAATGSSNKSSGAIHVSIPDGSIAGVFTQMSVSDIPTGAIITGMDVAFNITHTYNSDLAINITAPNGKTLNLAAGAGDAGTNFVNTVISSAGIDPLPTTTTNNITGTYAPDAVSGVGPTTLKSNVSSFSSLYSVPNGVWKLGIRDYGTPDTGFVSSWNLTIYYTLAPTFSWSPSAGLFTNPGGTVAYTGGSQQTVYAKNAPGNYTYNATIAFNGCVAQSADAVISIDAVPVATRSQATQTVCSGTPITNINFGTSNNVVGTIFNWTSDATDVTGIATSGTGDISGTLVNATSSPITVTYTATPTGPGATACPGADVTATVTVNPIPLATVIPTSQNSCSGSAISPINFGSSNSVSGTNYTWTRDKTTQATGIAASGTTSVSGLLTNASTPTTVTFSVLAVGPTGCTAGTPTTATVTVYNPSQAYTVSGSGQYCSPGAGLPVSLSNSQAGYSYQLLADGSPVGSAEPGTGSAIAFGNQSVSGIYTVTAANTGCTTTMNGSAVITSTPTLTPSVSIITSNTTICANTNANFFALGVNGGSAPTYNFMVNGNSIQNGSSNIYTTNSLANGDQVTCVMTSNNTCQTSATSTSNSIQITVNGAATLAAPASITGNSSICTIGAVTNLANTTNGGVWASSNTSVATVSNKGKVTGIANGNTIITYTVSGNGCSNSAAKVISVAEVPTITAIGGVSSMCDGTTALLTNATPGGVWSSYSSRVTINPSSGLVAANAAGTGTLRYTVTNAAGCSKYVVTSVIINPKPLVPSIQYAIGTTNPQTGPGGAFCINRTFTVVGSPTSAGSSWTSSNTNVMSVGSTSGVVNLAALGTATLTYTYVSAFGCTNSRSITGSVANCASKGVLGSSNQKMEMNFSLFPNPAKGNVLITVDYTELGGQIIVTDLFGKQVKTQTLSLGNNHIDVTAFSKGAYLVTVITKDGKLTKKLIVE